MKKYETKERVKEKNKAIGTYISEPLIECDFYLVGDPKFIAGFVILFFKMTVLVFLVLLPVSLIFYSAGKQMRSTRSWRTHGVIHLHFPTSSSSLSWTMMRELMFSSRYFFPPFIACTEKLHQGLFLHHSAPPRFVHTVTHANFILKCMFKEPT